MGEEKEHWTVPLGFKTTKEYVEHMSKAGAWGSKEYQKGFMERKKEAQEKKEKK